jgi:hypothetical protein
VPACGAFADFAREAGESDPKRLRFGFASKARTVKSACRWRYVSSSKSRSSARSSLALRSPSALILELGYSVFARPPSRVLALDRAGEVVQDQVLGPLARERCTPSESSSLMVGKE